MQDPKQLEFSIVEPSPAPISWGCKKGRKMLEKYEERKGSLERRVNALNTLTRQTFLTRCSLAG
jgi:hypothetical protein